LVAAILAAFAATATAAIDDAPVKTESGLVTGVAGRNAGVEVFRGIPYAAPPVGDLRWRPPQPAAKWDGVRRADHFSPICSQNEAGWYAPNNGSKPARELSEDCLYLDVYTAARSASDARPVIVFVHGGGLTFGAGSHYDGEGLARKGVVVVTLNYRLGVFGFLAHPELTQESLHRASGNYGFLDQIAALQWVQRNIKAFGGDPARVTLAGQSAGSWSVNYLMASPLAHGLFQRIIGESGGQFAPTRSHAAAEQAGLIYAKAAGADSLAALRRLPAADLLKVRRVPGVAGRVWDANVDGWFLPETVAAIFERGKQNDVPILIGSTAGEETSPRLPAVTADALREEAQRDFGADAAGFAKVYPVSSDDSARMVQQDLHRDETFGWPTREWARAQAKTGKSKVYFYFFNYVAPGPYADAGLPAPHGAELAFVYDWVTSRTDTDTKWRDQDRKLAETMSTYWINFATTGDPNGKGLVRWPPYNEKTDSVLLVGDMLQDGSLPHKDTLDFLTPYMRKAPPQ
jgi:para-nitrobenzyl esterase